MVKNPSANAGDTRDMDLILGLERASGGGNGNPLQHSCLRKPICRGAWWATVHRVTKKSDTTERLSTQRIKAPSHWDYVWLCPDKETLLDHPATVTRSLRPSSLEDTVMLSFKKCYANETTQHKALSGFLPSAECPWRPSKFMWVSIVLPFCCWVSPLLTFCVKYCSCVILITL